MTVTHDEPTAGTEAREGPLYDPAESRAPKEPTVFERRGHTVLAIGRDQGDAALRECRSQGAAIIGAVGDDRRRPAARPPAMSSWHGHGRQRVVDNRDFRGAGRGDAYSQRHTRTADQRHALRAFAPLGVPPGRALLFAGANVASRNVFSQCNRPRASSSPRKARHSASHTPCPAQSRDRSQHVDLLGYPSAKPRQRASVFSTQRTPSTTSRLSMRGRPPVRECIVLGGCGSLVVHCPSVSRILRLGMHTSGKCMTRTRGNVRVRTFGSPRC